MKAAKSATKHGIAEADGIHAASYPLWIEPLDDNPGQWRELRLGLIPLLDCWKPSLLLPPMGTNY